MGALAHFHLSVLGKTLGSGFFILYLPTSFLALGCSSHKARFETLS